MERKINNKYYEKKYIYYEILKECKGRDFSGIGRKGATIRGLIARFDFEFFRGLDLMNWDNHKQNLYVSVATLKEIPRFTFNPKKRTEETSIWYHDKYSDYVLKYDLFFDFDKKEADTWKELIFEVNKFKTELDKSQVPYTLIFSGSKGFQIRISGDYISINKIVDSNVFPHKTIIEKAKEIFNLKFLDLSNNGLNSRLCKLPYSLIVGTKDFIKGLTDEEMRNYPEDEMYVALPLSDNQFNNFNLEDMKVKNVFKKIPLIRRGTLERFQDLSLEQKIKNVEEFIKRFNLI